MCSIENLNSTPLHPLQPTHQTDHIWAKAHSRNSIKVHQSTLRISSAFHELAFTTDFTTPIACLSQLMGWNSKTDVARWLIFCIEVYVGTLTGYRGDFRPRSWDMGPSLVHQGLKSSELLFLIYSSASRSKFKNPLDSRIVPIWPSVQKISLLESPA